MGIYLNPSNESFQEAVDSEIYVDKTGLIAFTNKRIKTFQQHICVIRPRRFGKSTSLAMLAAYYSKGCDSRDLFAGLSIASSESYSKHLNQYNVIYINMQDFLSGSENIDGMITLLKQSIIIDLEDEFQDVNLHTELGLVYSMERAYHFQKVPFVILIDEWDCVMREPRNDKESQKAYLDFLRNWLKDKEYVALAYMTGILPIKKFGTQSGLNMFDEYSLLSSRAIGKYVDFTADEVSALCQKYEVDFEQMKTWYGGYYLNGTELYCPDSVVKAVSSKKFGGYWTEKETYEVLAKYIAMNFDGLHDTIEKLLAGQPQPVFTRTFSNDMVTFANKDNVLTLLVHLGYLGYNADDRTVYIPNKETADEFVVSMKAAGFM